ncbi:MAG TPA: hypothetical protein VGE52_07490 [Pirellulales bacterium]
MTNETLANLILLAGAMHFGILIASAIVPFQLNWREELSSLPKLHMQMYWTYGGYVVLAIVAIGAISVANASEIAAGSGLARGFCGYAAVFWGVRVALQAVFDVKKYLTAWWLTAGYHLLTVLFLFFTLVYSWAALRPGP